MKGHFNFRWNAPPSLTATIEMTIMVWTIGMTIMVWPKSRKTPASLKRKCQHYVIPLFDDCGRPIPEEDWEYTLQELKAERLLRKCKHNSPPLQDIDPDFGE